MNINQLKIIVEKYIHTKHKDRSSTDVFIKMFKVTHPQFMIFYFIKPKKGDFIF